MSGHKLENKLSMKLISVGDVEVGKSCLIKRYCEGSFVEDYITTIGIDYGVKKVPFNDCLVNINIFDLSGDDDYKTVRTEYYRDSMGVLMVYDVNIQETFDSLGKWEKEAERNGLDLSKCVVVVLGNKTIDAKVGDKVIAVDANSAKVTIYTEDKNFYSLIY